MTPAQEETAQPGVKISLPVYWEFLRSSAPRYIPHPHPPARSRLVTGGGDTRRSFTLPGKLDRIPAARVACSPPSTCPPPTTSEFSPCQLTVLLSTWWALLPARLPDSEKAGLAVCCLPLPSFPPNPRPDTHPWQVLKLPLQGLCQPAVPVLDLAASHTGASPFLPHCVQPAAPTRATLLLPCLSNQQRGSRELEGRAGQAVGWQEARG